MGFSRAIEALWPIVAVLASLPALRWYFGGTWRELDEAAARDAAELRATNRTDLRPFVAFVTAAVVFTVQQYFGGFQCYANSLRPFLSQWDTDHPWVRLADFDELYARGWWVAMRVVGFLVVPLAVNRALAARGGAAGFGVGVRDFFHHTKITACFLAIALPVVWIASADPGFAHVYPNYGNADRSGLDLLLWEVLYLAQFIALEVFLRGWLMSMLRGLGSSAIFAITVPYCMMHFAGKPYSEAIVSILAGIALGSLAAKTKSIWHGLVMHAGVALAMDLMVLAHRGGLPRSFWLPLD